MNYADSENRGPCVKIQIKSRYSVHIKTIYWHMNATQGGAKLHPDVNCSEAIVLEAKLLLKACRLSHVNFIMLFRNMPFYKSKN